MNDHQALVKILIDAEGNIAHMYLDTRGFVTVGIGHLLADEEAAVRLPFQTAAGVRADADAITREWEHVKQQKPAQLARYYEPFTTLRLAPEDVLALLDKDIAAVEGGVSNRFHGYPDYPASPQDALLDMAFNLGVGGLAKYIKLRAAAERKDWKACAGECHRNGVSDDRNNATRTLFLAAAENA